MTVPGKLSWSAKSLCAGLSILLAGAGLVTCGDSNSEASGENPISVVTSTTQICDYVKQLNIDEVDLTCLLAPNAAAHGLETTHEQLTKTGNMDLLFVNGIDLEYFLDQATESSGFPKTMAVTSDVFTADDADAMKAVKDMDKTKPLSPEKAKNGNYTIDRGVEKIDVAPWPLPPEKPGEEAEFCFDPYVWASPRNAKVQVANIGYALEKVAEECGDNELKSTIADHAAVYQDKLDQLDQWASKSIATASDLVLFTSHDIFGYFSHEFNTNSIGVVLSNLNEQQDATAARIAEAAKTVKDSGTIVLFAENSNNSKSIEAIVRAVGVKAIVGEDVLYGDSSGPADSDGETYIGSIIRNVTQVMTAWGGTVAPLPEGIK